MLWRRLALGLLFASIALLVLIASANPMEGGPCSPSGDLGGERFDSGGLYLSEWRSFPPGSKTCRLYVTPRHTPLWREQDMTLVASEIQPAPWTYAWVLGAFAVPLVPWRRIRSRFT